MATYIEGLVEALGAAGARPVLRHEGHDVAGAALLTDVHRYARALDGLGIGRGDLVALLAPNSPDALAVRYAAHLIGAAAVYLSVPPDPERRARMIAQFAPRLVVVFPETAELLPATITTTVTAPVAAVGPVRACRPGSTPSPPPSRTRRCPAAPAPTTWPW
jgi:fatty-acyl-CoA synthase